MSDTPQTAIRSLRIPAEVELSGDLTVPPNACGLIIFAHGSGSSRHSPRNRQVAARLQDAGFATLLFDLLTESEEAADEFTGHLRFDIDLLARRLVMVTRWIHEQAPLQELPIGYFGASTGAAAALLAATQCPDLVRAVVSRGGRPDLAGAALGRVVAATLLIVGGRDREVLELNRSALQALASPIRDLLIITGATHLFPEPGALEQVAELATRWFEHELAPRAVDASA